MQGVGDIDVKFKDSNYVFEHSFTLSDTKYLVIPPYQPVEWILVRMGSQFTICSYSGMLSHFLLFLVFTHISLHSFTTFLRLICISLRITYTSSSLLHHSHPSHRLLGTVDPSKEKDTKTSNCDCAAVVNSADSTFTSLPFPRTIRKPEQQFFLTAEITPVCLLLFTPSFLLFFFPAFLFWLLMFLSSNTYIINFIFVGQE